METVEFTPARSKWFWGMGIALGMLVVLFALALSWRWRAVRVLEADTYQLSYPEGFRYGMQASQQDGTYELSGWACMEREFVQKVDCWVVLHDTQTQTYYRIPTRAGLLDTMAAQAIGDGRVYGRAGVAAHVAAGQLKNAPEAYTLCFAFRTDGHNYLVETGETILVCMEAQG